MKVRPWFVGILVAAGGLLAALAEARAETAALELKRLESSSRAVVIGLGAPPTYMYRTTYPQSFFVQFSEGRVMGQSDNGAEAFAKIVKQQPKYEAQHPFRAVAKLGSQRYAFALDSVPPKPEKKEAPAEDKQSQAESKTEAKEGAEPIAETAKPKVEPKLVPSVGYNRLYFDLNNNGDLTDDKPIEAEPRRGVVFPSTYSQNQFPRIDLTVDVDGEKIEYAFFFSIYSQISKDFSYASASLNAAAYREGEITLEGKKRHLVLLDFNSNGRFDDELKIADNISTPDGQLNPTFGDLLLVDPNPSAAAFRSPYDVTTSDDQYHVSKLIDLDGRFYDLKTTPAGDKLTLTPSQTPTGQVTCPHGSFRAVIYSDKGMLKIRGDKAKPTSLPEGDWRLLAYTIDRSGGEPAAKQPEKPEKKPQAQRSLLDVLRSAITGESASPAAAALAGPRVTLVSARATNAYKPVAVRRGETVSLPFGPPYKAIVKVQYKQGPETVQLGMTMVGAAGEVCTDLMVNGGRPDAPEFTISNPKGEVVERGTFKYG